MQCEMPVASGAQFVSVATVAVVGLDGIVPLTR